MALSFDARGPREDSRSHARGGGGRGRVAEEAAARVRPCVPSRNPIRFGRLPAALRWTPSAANSTPSSPSTTASASRRCSSSSLVVLSYFWDYPKSFWLWTAIGFTGLVWPQLLYLAARVSPDSRAAERRNLLFDSFLLGCWAAA